MTDEYVARGLVGRLPKSPWVYAVAVLIMSGVTLGLTMWMPNLSGGAADSAERIAKMDALFGALPKWVLQWMGIQRFIMLGSLWFVIWHREARVYLVAVVLSHVISYTEIAFAPVERLSLGLVSLNHLVWIPALLLMIRSFPSIEIRTPYGLWFCAALFQLSFSLIFDIRDSIGYVSSRYF
jgi:hypothetical protein